MTPRLREFVDRVVVPALLERFEREQKAIPPPDRGRDEPRWATSSGGGTSLKARSKRQRSRRRSSRTTVWRPSAAATAQVGRQARTCLIACADIGDVFDDRNRLKSLHRLPPAIACAVASVTRRRRRDGSVSLIIQMRDKAAAHEELAVQTGLVPARRARSDRRSVSLRTENRQ